MNNYRISTINVRHQYNSTSVFVSRCLTDDQLMQATLDYVNNLSYDPLGTDITFDSIFFDKQLARSITQTASSQILLMCAVDLITSSWILPRIHCITIEIDDRMTINLTKIRNLSGGLTLNDIMF